MKDSEKIPSPFKTPYGYFDRFEERLKSRMALTPEQPLTVVHRRSGKYAWIAAASLLLLAGTLWAIFGGQRQQGLPRVVIKGDRDTMPALVQQTDSVQSLKTEEELMVALAEEPLTEKVAGSATIAVSPEEADIAAELDEAGLIVADLEDGIFEDLNIIP